MDAGISTSMDQLIGMLEEKKVIKVNDAAKELGTDKSHIEGWAKMLEKAQVIEMHYSVIGGALLKKGPKFDSVTKKGRLKDPIASEEEIKDLVPLPERKAALMKPPPKSAPKSYILIRKRIVQEEQLIEKELLMLREEQIKIGDYMNKIIDESNQLVEYIENLRNIVEQTNQNRGKKISKSPAK